MLNEEFMKLVENRFNDCGNLLDSKQKEYSRGKDKLHNFKAAGAMKDETPELALWGMNVKHIISIQDMIKDIDRDILYSEKKWAEKMNDAINYLLLLEGLLVERRRIKTEEQIVSDNELNLLQRDSTLSNNKGTRA